MRPEAAHGEYEAINKFGDLQQFIVDFTGTVAMSENATRQGILEFSGEIWQLNASFSPVYVSGSNLGPQLNISDQKASSNSEFVQFVDDMSDMGGNTNTPFAIDHVRTTMFTPENYRQDAFRVVILGTDGFPTNIFGINDDVLANETEVAAEKLRDEDDVLFVFLRIGNATLYPPNWFEEVADKIYAVASFSALSTLLQEGFLCLDVTHRPTASPAIYKPTASPLSSRPTLSPTTSRPSHTPSHSPSSSRPSESPSRQPSNAPTTSRPSQVPSHSPLKPTVSPTTSIPSRNPSISPSVSRPSMSPIGCSPGIVTCCVRFMFLEKDMIRFRFR